MPVLLASVLTVLLLGVAVVAVLPARPPSAALTQLLVMHDSLVAGRVHVEQALPTSRDLVPILQTRVTGVLEGRILESWLYQFDRQAFTVHSLQDTSVVPRNASTLPLGTRRVSYFELEDLQAIAWQPGEDELVVILGAGSLDALLRVGIWVDRNDLRPLEPR
jgi:hypothetical protein